MPPALELKEKARMTEHKLFLKFAKEKGHA